MATFFYYSDDDNGKGETYLNKLMDSLKEKVGIKPDSTAKLIKKEQELHVGVNIFKAGDVWKWVGVFTNSFRDDDSRPEIFSSDSHRRYVNKVDSGEYELPELWLYHEQGWKLGKALFVALDEVASDIVFVIAGGEFDADKSDVAEKIAHSGHSWQMSHGVPASEIVRSKEDNSIFDDYWSQEVSVVPAGKAANPLTTFGVIGDSNMIAQEKRAEINAALGVDDSLLDGLEAANKTVAATEAERREHKSKTEPIEKAEEVDIANTTDEAVDDVAEVEVAEVEEEVQEVEEPVAEEETEEVSESDIAQVEGLAHVLSSLDKSIGAFTEAMSTLANRVDALEKDKVEKEAEAEPVVAVTEVQPVPGTPVAFDIFSSIKSSVLSRKAAVITETDELSSMQPEETEPAVKSRTGLTLIDGLIAGSTANKEM